MSSGASLLSFPLFSEMPSFGVLRLSLSLLMKKNEFMIIQNLTHKLEETGMVSSNRQDCVSPDVIAKENAQKTIIIPEKFRADIEALQTYIGKNLESGLRITVSLQEILNVCSRDRKKVDAFNGLTRFLADEMNITLIIKSQKSKKK